jgi:hypothetical protein
MASPSRPGGAPPPKVELRPSSLRPSLTTAASLADPAGAFDKRLLNLAPHFPNPSGSVQPGASIAGPRRSGKAGVDRGSERIGLDILDREDGRTGPGRPQPRRVQHSSSRTRSGRSAVDVQVAADHQGRRRIRPRPYPELLATIRIDERGLRLGAQECAARRRRAARKAPCRRLPALGAHTVFALNRETGLLSSGVSGGIQRAGVTFCFQKTVGDSRTVSQAHRIRRAHRTPRADRIR